MRKTERGTKISLPLYQHGPSFVYALTRTALSIKPSLIVMKTNPNQHYETPRIKFEQS